MPAYSRSARAARALVGFRAAVAPLAAALALCSLSPQASALSKRDQAAVDALSQRMQSAEARYQSALVKIRNADPTGRQDSDAALEDMEDVIAACLKQKGCAPSTMLAGYKRLLKANADWSPTPMRTPRTPASSTATASPPMCPRPRAPPRCSATTVSASSRWSSTTRPCRPASAAG